MAYNLPGEHEYVRPDQFINLGIAALEDRAKLSRVFTRINGDIFKGAPAEDSDGGQLGQKVNYRLGRVASPAREYEFRTRTDPIVLGKIGTVTEAITLDQHIYHGVPVTNEQFTFDINRFSAEIAEPMADAVVELAESKVLAALAAAPFKTTNANADNSGGELDPYLYALSVRNTLNKQGTPKRGRVLLVGSNVEQWMLGSDRLSRLSEIGDTSALRQATLGDLAGMTVISDEAIGDNDIYAVHRSALLIANVAPELPLGVPYSARRVADAWSMLLTYQYESRWQQAVAVLSTYLGVNSVNDELTRDAETGGVVFDANGNPTTTGKNVRGLKGTYTPAT